MLDVNKSLAGIINAPKMDVAVHRFMFMRLRLLPRRKLALFRIGFTVVCAVSEILLTVFGYSAMVPAR